MPSHGMEITYRKERLIISWDLDIEKNVRE